MRIERKENLLNRLHDFANKHRGDRAAADVLMSFFRGECEHIADIKGRCELCGSHQPQKIQN